RLHVRGAHANAGYWRAPELTRAAWRNGYFDLMEIGRRDVHGNVTLLGRARDLIIRGGQNIFPGEIEELLARHPHVAEVTVIGLPDPDPGEVVAACVVRRTGAALDEPGLRVFLRSLGIAAFKIPALVVFFDALPLLDTGHKVDKQRLRDRVLVARAATPREPN